MNNPRFRILLVGCGSMAKAWVEYALGRSDAQLVGLVDVRLESAEAMRKRHGLVCPVFDVLEQALLATQPNLVFDVTIPEAHHSVVLGALAAGCDVLGEKPLAHSMEAARAMVTAAEATGRTYSVMQNRRYNNAAKAFGALLQNQIGELGLLKADFFLAPHFGGFRDAMASPLLLDMAIHTFDQARFFSGADAVSVYCQEFNPKGSWYAGNAATICIFEMSDGSVFSYQGSWCAEGIPTSWEGEWRAVGSGGTAIWDGLGAPYAEVVVDPAQQGFSREHRRVDALEFNQVEGHAGCLDEMFAALIAGQAPQTVCSDNIKSLAMVFGALESARSGKKVEL